MIVDYSTLKTAVADWLNRTDLTAVIPTMVMLAERRFRRQLRIKDQIQRATKPVAQEYTSLPSDWLAAQQLTVISENPPRALDYRTPDSAHRDSQIPGPPVRVSIVGHTLRLIPPPASVVELELLYYKDIPALSDAEPTNWLIELHPDLYLFGTLRMSAPYLRDDERLPLWEAEYQMVLGELKAEEEQAKVLTTPVMRRPNMS